jgi:endonuclease/exonuclease/phosphatase family metal-dependent hydrolase
VLLAAAAMALFALGAACGGDDDVIPDGTPTTTPQPGARTPTATPEPDQPSDFKVAFINLFRPVIGEAVPAEAADTFNERLDALIAQLKEFEPDIVGFNEAFVTKEHGSVIARLQKELRMEAQFARANPWFPGQDKESSDTLVKQLGFEEGELILVRSGRYPILKAERLALTPRTTEFEGRAALHVVVKGPAGVGEIDVFITHLTGGGDALRRAQASDFAVFIAKNRGSGPTFAMLGLSDPGAASPYEFFHAIGLRDVAEKAAIATCCRASLIGEQPPVATRGDFLLYDRWVPTSFKLFGDAPERRKDGTPFYLSDHNGIAAVFPIPSR